MSKIAIFTCSKNDSVSMLQRSVNTINETILNPVDLFIVKNNKTGLPKKYNEFLFSETSATYDYIVFVHDDVHLDDALIESKLDKYHKDYDIIGVAGGRNCKIQSPALWHIMCGGFGSGNLHGAVAHIHGSKFGTTSFGPVPERVAIIDGVFISVNRKKAIASGWRFNENYDFHHYDISSCLDANKLKLKIGVAPINLIHASPGLLDFNNPVFQKNQKQFLNEYNSY